MNRRVVLQVGVIACTTLLVSLGAAAAEQSLLERLKEYPNHRCEYKQEAVSVVLAAGRQARFVIVSSKGAPAPIRFAAEELKQYLDRITGGDFKIVATRPAGQPAIVLGDGPEVRAAGIDVERIARDGYAIVARAETILIAGKDDATDKSEILFDLRNGPFPKDVFSRSQTYPYLGDAVWDFERGTLYGAYRFLEELGGPLVLPRPQGRGGPG